VQQFSFGPEFQFADNMVGAIEYVGNRTRNGRRLRNLNEGQIIGNNVVFPYAQYGYGNAYLEQIVTNGRADYDALQARMQKRMSDGLSYTVAYTWGKALGDFLDHLSAGGGATGNAPGSTYAMEKDYGLLAFDIKHRLVTSFIYELPWGPGRHYEPTGVVGAIVRDWSVNGILTLSGGRPFTVTTTDQAGTGPGRIARANCLGDPVPDGFDQGLDSWMDPAAFAVTTTRTYGNCANNTVRGPSSKSMNLSLFRSIDLGADKRAEFRLETFNLFNWVNYGFPAASISNLGTFGRITTSIGDQREIQLALKFYF